MPESNWDWTSTSSSSFKTLEFRRKIVRLFFNIFLIFFYKISFNKLYFLQEDIIESKIYDLNVDIRIGFNSYELFEKLLYLNNEPFAQMWSLWALKNKFRLNCKNNIKTLFILDYI